MKGISGMEEIDMRKLKANRNRIVDGVLFSDIKHKLVQQCVFDVNDLQRIEQNAGNSKQLEACLDLLPFRGQKAYRAFYDSLQGYKWIQEDLEKVDTSDPGTCAVMKEENRIRLTKNRLTLLKDLDIDDVLNNLIQDDVLVNRQIDLIKSKVNKEEKLAQLLDFLPSCGEAAYQSFYNALVKHPWLQKALDETNVDDLCARVSETLSMSANESPKKCVRDPYKDVDHSTISIIMADKMAVENWKHIGRRLKVPESDIVDLECTHRGPKEQLYQTILHWQRSTGKEATVAKLIECLRNESCDRSADVLDGYLLNTEM